MTALIAYQGLDAVFRGIPGLRGVTLGEPTGDLDLPALYLAYQQFDRPLRNIRPARNLVGMRHVFLARLVVRWVDNAQAEMQLVTLLDSIPDAIDHDPRLGGRLSGGLAQCGDGIAGFTTIGDVRYRIVDYTIEVLFKIEGN